MALAAITDAIAKAGAHKAQARQAALWGLNAATYMWRRNPQTAYGQAARRTAAERDSFSRIAAKVEAELKVAKAALAPRLRVVARQSEAAYDTARKRVEAWHPRAKELARQKLAADPRATDTALAELIVQARGTDGFSPPGFRQVERAVSAWRGAPDGIPQRLKK